MLPRKISLFLFTALTFFPEAVAQEAQALPQRSMARWGVRAAGYSGIAPMGAGRYAVDSDNEAADGFFVFRIEQDSVTGAVARVAVENFCGHPAPVRNAAGVSARDCEGVAFFPPDSTVFISGEGDQRILEYDRTGQLTGRELNVPGMFAPAAIVPNYGFEALVYCPAARLFWAMTESTLPRDGFAVSPLHPGGENLLRLQAFGEDLQPAAQYAYKTDRGLAGGFGKIYVFGVSGMTALPDGRLLVLEREANIPRGYLRSMVRCRVYRIDPRAALPVEGVEDLRALPAERFLKKELLCEITTGVGLFRQNFANYEGMCLGRRLADGRQTLLLLSDSQGGYGKGPFRLKDYIKVLVLAR